MALPGPKTCHDQCIASLEHQISLARYSSVAAANQSSSPSPPGKIRLRDRAGADCSIAMEAVRCCYNPKDPDILPTPISWYAPMWAGDSLAVFNESCHPSRRLLTIVAAKSGAPYRPVFLASASSSLSSMNPSSKLEWVTSATVLCPHPAQRGESSEPRIADVLSA